MMKIITAAALVATSMLPAPAAAGPVRCSVMTEQRTGPIVRLMPLGDSITAGAGDPARNGYRVLLQDALRTAGANLNMVGTRTDGGPAGRVDRHNEGHSGWDSGQLLAGRRGYEPQRRLIDWLPATNPNVVLLQIGTNDAGRGISAATYAARLDTIIKRIHAHNPHAWVFVSTITSTGLASRNRVLAQYRRVIPGVVARASARSGGRVKLVEMSDIGTRRGELADALHPTPAGYRLMAGRWYAALKRHRPGIARW